MYLHNPVPYLLSYHTSIYIHVHVKRQRGSLQSDVKEHTCTCMWHTAFKKLIHVHVRHDFSKKPPTGFAVVYWMHCYSYIHVYMYTLNVNTHQLNNHMHVYYIASVVMTRATSTICDTRNTTEEQIPHHISFPHTHTSWRFTGFDVCIGCEAGP